MGTVLQIFVGIWVVGIYSVWGREVAVDVSAPWKKFSLDYVVEISQYLSSINEDPTVKKSSPESSVFWDFQSALCSMNSSIESIIAGSGDNFILRDEITLSAKQLLPANYQDLSELFLDLQNYVAAVSFFNSLAEVYGTPCGEGQPFVVLPDETISCSIPLLHEDQDKNIRPFEEFDHIYPSGASFSNRHIVIYGIPGSLSFCNLLSSAQFSVANKQLASFSFRPALSLMKAQSNFTMLQGFGVFLDIKNMEYKNVDDATAAASNNGAGEEEEFSDEEIAGINFKKLLEYNQQSRKELSMLKDRLLQIEMSASNNLKEEMKVWQMKDLGLQVIQSMSAVASKGSSQEALQYLTDIVHNFPRFASRVSATKVTHQVQEDSEKYFMSGLGNWIPGNSLFINGLRVDLSEPSFNVFDVLQKIQQEVSRESHLSRLNLGKIYSRRVYEAAYASVEPNLDMEDSEEDIGKDVIRVDVSKGGKYAVSFLNNLEKDEIYSQWPKALKTLMYPSWSLHALSRNIYTIVIVADILTPGGATLIQHARSMYLQQYPLRFGLVLDCDSETISASSQISLESNEGPSIKKRDVCRIFSHLKEKKGIQRATNFLFSLADLVAQMDAQGIEQSITRQQLLQIAASDKDANGDGFEGGLSSLLTSFSNSASKSMIAELDKMLQHSTKGMEFVSNSTAYLKARNLPINSYSLNGIVINEASLSSQTFMQMLGREQFLLGNWVKSRRLTDKTKNSIFGDIMTITKAFSRYHALLDDKATADYINPFDDSVLHVMQNSLVLSTGEISDDLAAADELLVIAQATPSGIQNVIESLKWLQLPIDASDDVVPSEVADPRRVNLLLAWRHPALDMGRSDFVTSSTGELEPSSFAKDISLFNRVQELVKSNLCTGNCVAEFQQALENLLKESFQAPSSADADERAVQLSRNADKVASKGVGNKDMRNAHSIVFFNGRLFPEAAVSDSSEEFFLDASDLQLLCVIESKKASKLTRQIVADLDIPQDRSVIPKASFLRRSMLRFLLSAHTQVSNSVSHRVDVSGLLQRHIFARGLEIPSLMYSITPPSASGEDDYLFNSQHDNLQLYVIVDPLSLAGQRAVAVIDLLTTRLRASVNLLLVPRLEINEFPLQNFYRFVFRHTTDTSAGDNENQFQGARFSSLPRQHVLTVRMDTPESWNVQATRALQDPDNLRCTAQACGDNDSLLGKKEYSSLGYTLKSLLVAGQCLQSTERDVVQSRFGLPPNGLQLVLTENPLKNATNDPVPLWDTLVMQNLGYFQLQAKTPGWYRVQLASGKANSLYRIYSAQGDDNEGLSTPVLGFGDKTHRLIVVKRRGMESYSLLDALDDNANSGGFWNSLSSGLFGGKSQEKKLAVATPAHDDDDKIHVFSLATGHMYERLLRIMMLSVSRQSSRRVKFWLLENYLSPSFKAMAEVMSKRFGFDVAYVTYKWPHWLRHQTQQQRIIWGYKILFLDVLFPLHLKKIIYVDADQVVRSDIAELWDMDLQGHAYAYTPFCTSREETLGFQFWRQGYWKDHLQGRPYHISALYVVDLARFRQQTVGDQLRAIYDQLSRDPNSLSNLDQDLPNYAQHAVPIFSLPQEWLWCETWCSEGSKSKAKTIDLCNNPLHKEPKLDMARRVISGKLFNQSWIELDSEIRQLTSSMGLLQD